MGIALLAAGFSSLLGNTQRGIGLLFCLYLKFNSYRTFNPAPAKTAGQKPAPFVRSGDRSRRNSQEPMSLRLYPRVLTQASCARTGNDWLPWGKFTSFMSGRIRRKNRTAVCSNGLISSFSTKAVLYKFRFYQENAGIVLAFHHAKAATTLLDVITDCEIEAHGDMSASSILKYELYYYPGAFYNIMLCWLENGMKEEPEAMADEFLRILNHEC